MPGCCKRFINFITCKKPTLPDERTIYIDNNNPIDFVPFIYPNNLIVSSRYTAWNYIFKCLFEQFQRIANFYFILVMIVQLLIDSPVSPFTTIVPIVFVISVSLVKQGFEDIMRHKSDNEVNLRKYEVYSRESGFQLINSRDIVVGNVIKVDCNKPFPCDLIMLKSSEKNGECLVTTANLDGETSLKTFSALEQTQKINYDKLYQENPMKINCTQPEEDLYTFCGTLELENENANQYEKVLPLNHKNTLLRGAVLKNTEQIIGVAVYTGADTKLSLNCKMKSAKYSQVELKLNYFLIVYFSILFLWSVICLICLYVYKITDDSYKNGWYIPRKPTTAWLGTQEFFGYIVLYNYLVPISLYVTVEIQKFLGSFAFKYDIEMYDSIGDNRARVNTSDLNEELGQITYLFSDKTGTLTENDMQFRRCSINGVQYIDVDGKICKMCLNDNGMDEQLVEPYDDKVTEFLIFLCVCHTVQIDRSQSAGQSNGNAGGGITGPLGDKNMFSETGIDYEYQASSPDEKSFVEASRRYGIVFHGTIDGFLTLTVFGKTMKYKILEVFDFDSDRKCMSVIVEFPDGSIRVLCKGAESSMLPKANKSNDCVNPDLIMDHINQYAEDGLRTLVFGYRIINKHELERMLIDINNCKKSLQDSEKKIRQLYSEIECNMVLIGCTGIEDRLQDGVKETLVDLRAAGIKVWVLTGDKEETAVNISYSAGHFSTTMQEMRITQKKSSEEAYRAVDDQIERLMETRYQYIEYCLIVDGATLKLLSEPFLYPSFIELCCNVSTVLCCRLTPLQKADIVQMVKLNVKPPPITCAIGDGGNDVSMIAEAHVGIGLFGKEGRQAARAADYALGRFRFLRRALLFHGHVFYSRLTNLIQYFFYKNMVFIAPQFYYSFVNLQSAQPIYYTIILMLYNVTFTTLPILVYGILEQSIPKKDLLTKPHLYKRNRDNKILNPKNFVLWNFYGVWHSLVIFLCCYGFYSINDSIHTSNGTNSGLMQFGMTLFFMVWVIVNAKLYLITYHFNIAVLVSFLIVLIGNVSLLLIFNVFKSQWFFYRFLYELYSSPAYWLQLLIVSLLALTPDIIHRIYKDRKLLEILLEEPIKYKKPRRRISYIPSKMKSNAEMTNSAFENNDEGGFKEIYLNSPQNKNELLFRSYANKGDIK